jgi:hypothetical protein
MVGDRLGIDLDVFHLAVWTPVAWLLDIFTWLAGIG